MKTTELFSEFEKPSAAAWKQRIQAALKGADYQETLVWSSPEGIDTKPFYTQEDLPDMQAVSLPKSWCISQAIGLYKNEGGLRFAGLLALAQDALKNGVDQLWLENYIPQDSKDLEDLIALQIPIEVLGDQWPDWALQRVLASEKTSTDFRLFLDPLGYLVQTGNWPKYLDEQWNFFENMGQSLAVDARRYADSGANLVEELAATLLHVNAYLNHPVVGQQLKELRFHLAIGPHYFYEIAKLRALRILARDYFPHIGIRLFARPGIRNKTVYDYNVNLLRSSSECMAAILGGVDVIYNLPYDFLYADSNDFGHRIARNQLLLLKHESGLHSGYTEGTYYIEALSSQLVDKAKVLFTKWSSEGDLISLLKTGETSKKNRPIGPKGSRAI